MWLQTRKKSETEERWMEQLQKLQAEVWQALRIGELQKVVRQWQRSTAGQGASFARSLRRIIVEDSPDADGSGPLPQAMGQAA